MTGDDPFSAVWPWLDRGSKQALRCVNKAMRSQVDGAVRVLASPADGASGDQLGLARALLRWPSVVELIVNGVSNASNLAPLSKTSVAGLTRLAVREAPQAGAWDILAFSSNVAATLRVIDISGCACLRSIDAVRSCVRLRCLWMPHCLNVSDLDREEAQHRALWPAFLAAKAAGKRAQFHRARLVVDGERVPAPAC
ncbi:hypothetical protein FOA52_015467 [Chlamydomonas sp. UWO 241]|nr:hypothetical protein FOA52_015467 [Chlamydomonas sp. UWO 241]